MKKMMTMMVMLCVAMTMFAKDIKTVVFTTSPKMQCENCENKIKGNLKFEKGVKEITTNVAEQKVTIKYDADKTSPEKLAKAFTKFNYQATQVGGGDKKGCCQKANGKQDSKCCCCKDKKSDKQGKKCCKGKGKKNNK